jgi:quercetin dioxygenase-like cupin family protein
MHVLAHTPLVHQRLGGELCLVAADRSRGVACFEVWVHTLDALAQTPQRQHGGELVVLVLAGGGKLLIDGAPQRFNAPCTLLIPPNAAFRLVNNGAATMQLVWVFTEAPITLSSTLERNTP